MSVGPAERLLKSYGITNPSQIDLEAIAHDQGVIVKYRPLLGCEARIVGTKDRAIISVDSRQSWTRQRFSVAHELGHWHHHRGKVLTCQSKDIGNYSGSAVHRERLADRYAANFLLPPYLFRAIAAQYLECSFDSIRQLSALFKTSITSTAIQAVNHGPEIMILVCHGKNGRKWFQKSKGMPDHWFPNQFLDRQSYAFDLMHSSEQTSGRELVPANAWFDECNDNDYELYEDSFKISDEEVLSILVFKDDEAVIE